MLTKIAMPDGGQNTDQLLVVSWKKQVGDKVERGDILLEVETDKAVLEVESFAAGTLLAQAVPEGSYGTAGEPIAYVGSPEDIKQLPGNSSNPVPLPTGSTSPDAANPSPVPAPPTHAEAGIDTAPYGSSGSFKASPAAKRRARERGLDLVEVARRSGKQIVHAADLERFAPAADGTPPYDLIRLTAIRRTIAERMIQAAAVPAFSVDVEVKMAECIRLRDLVNTRQYGAKISFHDVVGKCMALAAREHPLVNASYTESGIRVFRPVNLGLAVAVEGGLIVPVVLDVGSKPLARVAKESAANIAKVRSGKFDPRLTEGGTITLSNLGNFPVSRFTAILNPPQSCIVALGMIQSRAVWVDGKCCECPMATLTSTFDHRVVDGAYGAAFLTRLKNILENPGSILLKEDAER